MGQLQHRECVGMVYGMMCLHQFIGHAHCVKHRAENIGSYKRNGHGVSPFFLTVETENGYLEKTIFLVTLLYDWNGLTLWLLEVYSIWRRYKAAMCFRTLRQTKF